jgi:hypothetical protein
MDLPMRLLAALLCGLLMTGCCAIREDAVTVHVHLDRALTADLATATPADACPDGHGGGSYAGGPSSGTATLSGFNGSVGRDAGLAIVAVLAVVVVAVLVVVTVEKIHAAVTATHADAAPPTYALAFGDGTRHTQELRIRDGHAIRLDQGQLDSLGHGVRTRAFLQQTGTPVVLPVQVVLDGAMLSVRPLAADPSR